MFEKAKKFAKENTTELIMGGLLVGGVVAGYILGHDIGMNVGYKTGYNAAVVLANKTIDENAERCGYVMTGVMLDMIEKYVPEAFELIGRACEEGVIPRNCAKTMYYKALDLEVL